MFILISLLAGLSFIFFLIGLFSPETSLFWYNNGERTKKLSSLIYLASWLGLGVINILFAPKVLDNPNTSTIATTSKMNEKPEITSNWRYDESTDNMTSKTVYLAHCISENELDFKFPYSGGVQGKLNLRLKNGESDVYLNISKGQFMPSIMQEKSIRVRFDNDNPMSFTYSSASDGSPDIIFLNSVQKFIKRLKSANKVLIEAEYFNEGNRQFEFNVSNLKWNH